MAAESTTGTSSCRRKPAVIIVIGLAGSGKTAFVQRLSSWLQAKHAEDESKWKEPYCVNLDPAVSHMPYEANIDIRDTVDYKKVMSEYRLGPNGALLTSVNLFATKFDQVVDLVDGRRDECDYVIADTPGQIEIFTWSASGHICTEGFASQFPTVVAFVMDTPRCTDPKTFMSNMTQACSVLYKFRLPMILVFNKSDVVKPDFCIQWMKDFEAFQEAISSDGSYAATLCRSLSMVLDDYYQNIRTAEVSSLTGSGIQDFFDKVELCVDEYEETYFKELQERIEKRQKVQEGARMGDLSLDDKGSDK